MIPYDVDPSLHNTEPHEPLLGDGFSPPERSLAATHPVEPESVPPGSEPVVPNPSHLPIEPEFAPQLPPAEPDDPLAKPPAL